MPFPIAHGVVAASLFIGLQKKFFLSQDARLISLSVALSVLPDADFALEWIFNIEGAHRSFTHSISFSVAIGLLAAVIVGVMSFRQRLALILAPLSHALLDVLVTSSKGTGIQLLWPISNYRYKLGLFDYFIFDFNPRFDPWDKIFVRLLEISLLESVVMVPILLVVIFLKSRGSHQNNIPV